MYILAAQGMETMLPDLGEKLTLIAALAFFLYYFMRELKQVREQMERKQMEYDKKFESMFERVSDMERKNMEVLNRLAEAVEGLKEQLTHNRT